jgi:hypothetical protein
MSTLLLKKIEAQVQRTFFSIFIPFKTLLGTATGSTFFVKIVSALTNKRAIDKNYRIIWKGDEREEL